MNQSTMSAITRNFLGNSPIWYKQAILFFLVANPILLLTAGPVVTGWLLIFEFIFTLAMALKCYPLQPGGLIAIEAVVIGLTDPHNVYHEINANLEVILLLMFMVAGIYFMKDLLLWVFTKILVKVRSKTTISLLFSISAAFLSAFLDALTVTAVLISVGVGFYSVYHKVASGKNNDSAHDHTSDHDVHEERRQDLENFRGFLRSLLMHGAVGTALGGVCTLVGEPQNLLIAQKAEWTFIEFFVRMAPITMPVLAVGLLTVVVLEKTGTFGYGAKLPENVRQILVDYDKDQSAKMTKKQRVSLIVQAAVAVFLVIGLAFHLAPVGMIGLTVIILLTAFNGITEEHQIGKAFEEALPFTALLVVFFTVVSVIHDQHLFQPIIHMALSLEPSQQPSVFFIANGVLSAISDNVFVATVYINEILAALNAGDITREQFDHLAVAVNTGTNIPSVATPNGQAAFLFLLTSAIAPLIRLSYGTMVWMALPYTITMSVTGLLAVIYAL
ncbi:MULTISPECIES: sodium/proton antiporter NhaB [unclassified Marinobacterium]|jgi:Na+:H+ antiporter, NhaB family|uniref:sodium/proton antiporter NhaB n=1 Tax=unclassified Marinobacterium TaxID=2644139 RepID=UPI0015685489|nr:MULTISPECIES: sodium/proton antiporter NhaB [unclassified Marinobacterium]NRP10481.1 Na(+)/H(+) antiporter NhaB [Marinobacterium sp. xm-g-48]NRP15729.1 Na(+)/H(+) antiporter NhaB [Marinobacterium sp. xm-a-152]NRP38870.1 Na(+)/H(+) antiporter NhaB [Marinobacterium sp. xm-a-121]NRP51747.1 Na(+)/H(+) antiporter NhaB [Marinobacterium sp. xm-v-242]NRP57802.1 Na(+)/H(+) antiporter NhaB [Marinobacterium sp. xm-d-510]